MNVLLQLFASCLKSLQLLAIDVLMVVCLVLSTSSALANPGDCNKPQFDFSFWDIAAFTMAPPVELPGGDLILTCLNNGSNEMIKLNSKGDTVWTKDYVYNTHDYLAKVKTIIDYDGNLLSIGGRSNLLKTDTAGKVLKTVNLSGSVNVTVFTIIDMYLLANGDKAILINANDDINGWFDVMVIDKNLTTVKWLKHISHGRSYDMNAVFMAHGDRVVVSTTFYNNTTAEATTALTLLNANNGQVLAQNNYSDVKNVTGISAWNNGYVLIERPGYTDLQYIRTDKQLNIISARSIPGTPNYYCAIAAKSDGSFIAAYANYASVGFVVFYVGADDKVKWADSVFNFNQGTVDVGFLNSGLYVSGNFYGSFANTNNAVTIPYIFTADNYGNFSADCNYQFKTVVNPQPQPFTVAGSIGVFTDTSI